MKKIIGFLVIMVFAVTMFINNPIKTSNNLNIDLANLFILNTVNAETTYSCTVERSCDTMGSKVSCTGVKSCERIFRGVKCDGKSTYC
ncbi:MAG: hypothetical protein PF436_00485 [Prolixibacteraceae bacterium]|jgi:hypothetical protein|nr:hypothetical protein [Prolixibacteraceae bacterium]